MKTIDSLVEGDTQSARERWVDAVRGQVESLRYGVVQIVIHDSRVVQIEKTEKIRFDQTEAR